MSYTTIVLTTRWVALLTLLVGAVGELLLQSRFLNHFGPWWSPVWWLVCGLLVSVAGFGLLTFSQGRTAHKLPEGKYGTGWIGLGVFVLGAVFCGVRLSSIFADFPIGPEHSDIIPSLQMYVRRLLSGETVYAPLEFPTWTVLPTYFPVMWLPYTFSEILNIDYRWTAYGVFLLACGLYLFRVWRGGASAWEMSWKTLLPFVYLLVFISTIPRYFGLAVELMPAGLYLILALTVFRKSPWMMAFGIGLCLLSRYALSFWLPVYLVMLWGERGFRTAFSTGLGVAAMVLALYVIPFLSKDWTILTDGLAYYQTTAEGQWHPQSWQGPDEPPTHLFRGLSFAPWFYDNVEYEVVDRLSRNKKFHLAVSLGAAVLLLVGYLWLRQRRHFNPRLYALVGLKFYLTIFYAWLYVPFAYLYMLPCLFTLVLLWEIMPLLVGKQSVKV